MRPASACTHPARAESVPTPAHARPDVIGPRPAASRTRLGIDFHRPDRGLHRLKVDSHGTLKRLHRGLERGPGFRQEKTRGRPKLGAYLGRIEEILKADRQMPGKQGHPVALFAVLRSLFASGSRP